MRMAPSLASALRNLFCVIGCVVIIANIYAICVSGLPFRLELLTPWMVATLVDFYINILALGAWIVYKEACGITAIIWVVLLVCFGSITSCGYIALQFLKLSPQQSSQDPIYFVLSQHQKKDQLEEKRKLCIVTAKLLFGALACLMLGTLVYTLIVDGSPFRKGVLTVWLTATLIDFYANVVVLSIWVVYKESSWTTAIFWILLFICSGSISTCIYIVLQLFHLSPEDPVHLILFRNRSRAESRYEGTSQEEGNNDGGFAKS